MMALPAYRTRCWNCLNDFDAVEAVWCSCDPKHPSKVCPFCLNCFCPAGEDYKEAFWARAPETLREEVAMLERSQDRIGEILIQNQKLTTPQLLEALKAQKKTGGLLGKILIQNGWVTQLDVDAALRHQGYKPLVDSHSVEQTPSPVSSSSPPKEILNYLLVLGAKKGASDIHIEPQQEELAIKMRIDGMFYKAKPFSRSLLQPLTDRINSVFELDPQKIGIPQKGRAAVKLLDRDYDLLVLTLPTRTGTAITIKLIDRRYFLKNFTALGLTPPDQLFLVRALDAPAGLILVTSPPYNGALSTCYSLMDHIAKSERKVVSLERSIQWEFPYVHQVEVNPEAGLDFPSALRSAASIKPDVIFLLELGDKETATMLSQLAMSRLVVTTFPAFSAAESVWRFYELGVPGTLIGRSLSMVLNQRLVRRICPVCRDDGTTVDPRRLSHFGITLEEARALKIYRGKGCAECNRIGFKRRKGVFEIMTVDHRLRNVLSRSPTLAEIESVARESGMETLRERCLRDVSDGTTSIDEFIRWRL